MTTNFAPSLQLVLIHEGGKVDDPHDPGGRTNKGVTQRVYTAYRANKGEPAKDVYNITADEVRDIYKAQYWDRAQGDRLPAGLDYAVFDYSVNSGVSRAVKDLQRTLNANAGAYGLTANISVDGAMGEGTLAAVQKACERSGQSFIVAYCDRRLAFLRSLSTFGRFGAGWTRRVNEVKSAATGMARGNVRAVVASATAVPAEPAPAKAPEAAQSTVRSPEGAGAITGGVGVGGMTVIQAAQQVQPQIGDSLIGKLALVGFVLLMIAGLGLLYWQYRKKQAEKATA